MASSERYPGNYILEKGKKCLKAYLSKAIKRSLVTVIAIIVSASFVNAQGYSSDVNWLINELELEKGSVVADIGAGDGDQTLAIADYVGPEGQVFSTELGSASVQELREAVSQVSLDNITVVEGHPTRTNLPENCCDAIYLRKVYHHFGDPALMNNSIFQTLKPGGRLAVIDFEPRRSEAEPGGRASGSHHGVTAETVVEEFRQAGFKLISSEQKAGDDIYVVMEKPGKE